MYLGKTCPLWKRLYSDFCMTLEMIKDYNIRVSKRIGKFNSKKEKLEYRITHPFKTPTQQVKNSHKIVSQIISRSFRKFMVETDMISHLFNSKSVPMENDFVYFSKELYNLCLGKLVEFINEYQIKELPHEQIVKNKIKRNTILGTKQNFQWPKCFIFTGIYINTVHLKKHLNIAITRRLPLYRYIERFSRIGNKTRKA